jgi:hypothetical protein
MKSFRQVAIKEALSRLTVPDSPISGRSLIRRIQLEPPIPASFKRVFDYFYPEEVRFHGIVVTPAGTSLGGWVDWTFRSNGTYSIHFHMHDSGIPDYMFQVRAIFTTPSGLVFAAQHSGNVEGTISWTPLHEPDRDDDHYESGRDHSIETNWSDIKKGRLWVTKDYSTEGIIGFVQDWVKFILDVEATIVGGALGVLIGLGAEIGQIFGDLGIGGSFGVVGGVVLFVTGNTIVIAVVGGVAIGAATNAMIKQRELSQEEAGFAAQVFGGSLPSRERIKITNLSGLGGRAFTMPCMDNKNIYLNVGEDAFKSNNLTTYTSKSYSIPGQLLIHELTHAWQIKWRTFLPGTICQGIVNQVNNEVGESVYEYGPPGDSWSGYGLEGQAAIVDEWFAGAPTVAAPNRSRMDSNDPYFRYIQDNIREGRP